MEIDDAVIEDIRALCTEGDTYMDSGEPTQAYERYMAALALVPEPKEEFEAATWILAALGDLYFFSKDFAQVEKVLSDAMRCAGGIGNPFLHLRLGQARLELKNEERAVDELCRAYMSAGKEIFENDDPKYFEFLKSRTQLPAGGRW